MSTEVQRWNTEQIKIHNIGVDSFKIRCATKDGKPDCFNKYVTDRTSCLKDSGLCQIDRCDNSTNDFSNKQLCMYNSNPTENTTTYDIYSSKKLYNYDVNPPIRVNYADKC